MVIVKKYFFKKHNGFSLNKIGLNKKWPINTKKIEENMQIIVRLVGTTTVLLGKCPENVNDHREKATIDPNFNLWMIRACIIRWEHFT